MGLGTYADVIRRRWRSIIFIAIVIFGAVSIYTLMSPKKYTATAQNFVALTGETGGSSSPLTGAQFAAQRVKSYTQIVGSPDVLLPVIDSLSLPYSATTLATMVTATNPPLTVLIDVTASDTSPQQAAQIANAVSVQLGRTIEQLETPNAQTIAPVKVTLTEPAQPPTSPSSPKTVANLVLGLLFGLIAGCAWAFVRNAVDSTVKAVEELDSITQAPSLGVVPFDPNAKTQVLTALDSKSVYSEGYRTTRANLQYVNVDDPIHAFVVTSAAPGDGKTTVACNLAIALAQAGKRVCLVEADLRRPRVSEYLQVNPGAGLTEVLAGQVSLTDALQDWGRGMFKVLPPGAIPPNPSELLGSHQMAQVVAKLKREFDVVILDAPPLLAVSDAAVLASQADGAVIVVRYGRSSQDAVRNAVASLEQINAKVLGTVLNAIPAKRGAAYGYGYGYGYGDDTNGKAPTPSEVAKAPTAPNGPANTSA